MTHQKFSWLKCHIFTLAIVALATFKSHAQELDKTKQYDVVCVGFYNLENLFDTIVDPDPDKVLQEDFTPIGPKRWTSKKYYQKLENLSQVLSEIGTDLTPDGAAVIGLCELENREVIEDLIKMPKLKDRNYQIVHYHSPDARGIDVALIYNPKYFTLDTSFSFRLVMADKPKFRSRDQLLVSGNLLGERVHFMVNHWPSKSGGEKRSRPNREAAARLGRSVIDSIQTAEPNAKLIYMGDLNDEPHSNSVKHIMNTVKERKDAIGPKLYNPMEKLHDQGIGSHSWQGVWGVIDQMLFTPGFVAQKTEDFKDFRVYVAKIYNKEYLITKTGNWKGTPFRSFGGDVWQNGYSDHFAVYSYLVREKKE